MNILKVRGILSVKVQSKPVKVPANAQTKVHSKARADVDDRLENAIVELLALQEVLSAAEVDGHVLSDFRDALNRVRNTAWAAQKYVASRQFNEGTAGLTSFLAGERVRCAFQLCRTIHEDLEREDVQFQRGQLAQLQVAVSGLGKQLQEKL
jgi:hypothetical protein